MKDLFFLILLTIYFTMAALVFFYRFKNLKGKKVSYVIETTFIAFLWPLLLITDFVLAPFISLIDKAETVEGNNLFKRVWLTFKLSSWARKYPGYSWCYAKEDGQVFISNSKPFLFGSSAVWFPSSSEVPIGFLSKKDYNLRFVCYSLREFSVIF